MKPILLAALALLSLGVAQAQTTPPSNPNQPPERATKVEPPPPAFETVDTDRDGSVSATEFDNARIKSTSLALLDKNSDGKLSRDEWNSQPSKSNPTDRR